MACPVFSVGDRVEVSYPLALDMGKSGEIKRIDAGKFGLVWLRMDYTTDPKDRLLVGFPRECLELCGGVEGHALT